MENNNKKQLSSVNQLYQKSIERDNGVSFKEWIDPIKHKYAALCNGRDTKPSCDFLTWVNIYENRKHNSNEAKQVMFKNANDTFEANGKKEEAKAETKAVTSLEEQEKRTKEAMADNKILGFKPLVFYSVAAALTISVVAGVILFVKYKRSKANGN